MNTVDKCSRSTWFWGTCLYVGSALMSSPKNKNVRTMFETENFTLSQLKIKLKPDLLGVVDHGIGRMFCYIFGWYFFYENKIEVF